MEIQRLILLTKSLRTYVYKSIKEASDATDISREDIVDSVLYLTETDAGYFLRKNSIVMLSETNEILAVYKNVKQASCMSNVKQKEIKLSYENDILVRGVYFALIDKFVL